MSLVHGWVILCSRSGCRAALPLPGQTIDDARAAAGELGWSSRIFEAAELGGGCTRNVGDMCPDHQWSQLEYKCSTSWTPGALMHCADCPMTNERAAARNDCTCDVIELAMQLPRDTPEGRGP